MASLFAPSRLARRIVPSMLAAALASGLTVIQPAVAQSAAPVPIDLPAQPLGQALNAFARQAGVQLLVAPELVAGRRAPAVSGLLAPSEALRRLLAGSGLEAVAQGDALVLQRSEPRPAPGARTLGEVTVTASGQAEHAWGPVPGYTARRSATATRTDTPLNEIPQSISVITAEQIRDQNAQTMQEVLRYTAGVHADVYGLDNRGDWFTLRGGSQGSTLLDGLRRPLTGWYGVVRDEPYAFERVEVLRGPASVMAGQNGPGGVVNLVSKRPQAESAREVSLQVGNHDHKQVAADLTGALNEDGSVLYRVVALNRDSGTQVEYADIERQYFAPSLTWNISPATSLWVYTQYQNDRSGNTEGFFPLEGTLYDGPNGRIPVERYVSEPDWDTYGGRRWRIGYEFSHAFNEQWKLTHRLRHDDVKGRHRSLYANYWEGFLADGRSLNRTWYATDDQGRITNADLFMEGRIAWGSVQHTLLVGMDAMRQRSSRLYWSGAATPLDVYTPAYGQWTPPDLTEANTSAANTGDTGLDQWGLLLQDQMKFGDRWVLVAALRHDRSKSISSRAEDLKVNATTHSLGGVYLADGGWSPYLSYAESFEPQGANLQGKPFDPKRGKQIEAGLKWQPAAWPVTASAAVYNLRETGRVTDGELPGTTRQLGDIEVKGVELELHANLRAWDLVAAYTRTDTEDRETGKRVANVPNETIALWAVHRFGGWGVPGLKAGLGVRHVGSTWDGHDTLKTAGVDLVDAMVSYDIDRWLVALNVSNLADKTYFAACLHRGDCWYGTKRKVTLSATLRW